MIYTFDYRSFLAMPKELNCRSLASYLRPLNISRNTYAYWQENEDLPLDKMLAICKHYDVSPSLYITAPSASTEGYATTVHSAFSECLSARPIADIFFRRALFSDMLTNLSHRTVKKTCELLSISTATFTRYLRPSKNSAKGCISVKEYLRWCNTLGLNPLDFLYKGEITVKLNY